MDFGQHPYALCQDEVAALNDVIEELQGTLAAVHLGLLCLDIMYIMYDTYIYLCIYIYYKCIIYIYIHMISHVFHVFPSVVDISWSLMVSLEICVN